MKERGPNVKFELSVDELQGTIRVVRLRQVVDNLLSNALKFSSPDGGMLCAQATASRKAASCSSGTPPAPPAWSCPRK